MKLLIPALMTMALAGQAAAQPAQHQQQPYTGLQVRAVKALSEQQIADLRAGRGMGLAMPAELNSYPGPMHVLEHAVALSLTAEQRERTAALIATMKAEAIPLGERLIEQETKLDELFAKREITPASLQTATAEIGATQARLRETHLKYHLAMRDLLTAEQIEKYQVLRGYRAEHVGPHRHQ
jgi:Spy/CpxP family protein refolding chaperone